MSERDLIRAWTDLEYRESLSADQRAALAGNPAGPSPLGDGAAAIVVGGETEHLLTIGCCGGITSYPGFCSLFCGGGGGGYHSDDTLCLQRGYLCNI